MDGLLPPAYQGYAEQLMTSFAQPAAITTADEVAHAIHAAATDDSDRLRFPAGPDSAQLANARGSQTDEDFLQGMRAMLRMRR